MDQRPIIPYARREAQVSSNGARPHLGVRQGIAAVFLFACVLPALWTTSAAVAVIRGWSSEDYSRIVLVFLGVPVAVVEITLALIAAAFWGSRPENRRSVDLWLFWLFHTSLAACVLITIAAIVIGCTLAD